MREVIKFYFSFLYSSSLNMGVKKLLQLFPIYQSYHKDNVNKSDTLKINLQCLHLTYVDHMFLYSTVSILQA